MRRVWVIAFAALEMHCGTTLTAPVGAGKTRVAGAIGGPMVVFGAPIPVPVATLGVAHGLSDAVDLHGDLQLTAAAFGVAGLGGGVVFRPITNKRSALSIALDGYGFGSGRDAVLIADPWIATRWRLVGDKTHFDLAAGFHAGLRLATSQAELREISPFIPMFFLQPALTVDRTELSLELRWYTPGSCAGCAAPEWVAPGGSGAIGLVIGISYAVGSQR